MSEQPKTDSKGQANGASPSSGGAERFATIALLLLALAAAGALLWSSRGTHVGDATKGSASSATASASARARPVSSGSDAAPVLPPRKTAQDLLSEACPGVASIGCVCRLKALDRSFALADSSLNAELLAGAQSDAGCTATPGFRGFKAEALARIGSSDAKAAIGEALRDKADDAHALFAQAYQTVLSGEASSIPGLLDQAERAGRGAAVDTLRGVWQLKSRQTEPAKASFERAMAADPSEVDALYNLAAIEATRGVYNRPRGLLLKVLKLRPDHLDARFALASLAFKAGATSEASRHASLLEAAAPTGDPRVIRLRELMKAPRPAASSSAMGAPVEVRVQGTRSRTP